MIRVRTGSRLHFGLFSLPSEQAGPWLNQEGEPTIPRRQFGGVGMMIEKPGIELTVEEAKTWSAAGPLADRALDFAHRYCTSVGITDSFRVQIVSAAPQHVGLGTGTQLGLAVVRALADLTETRSLDGWSACLAQHIGRGARSAVGIHGFYSGGFIVEAGSTSNQAISPLVVRQDVPPEWGVLLILPRGLQGQHGVGELKAFADLARQEWDDRTTDTLCRIVLLGMLPNLSVDVYAFGEAVYDFNRRVGEIFKPVQGGIYAHPRIEHIVKAIRDFGVKGVGQSSWGPAIFAIGLADEVVRLRNWLSSTQGIANEEMTVTGSSRGVVVTRE